MPGGRNTAGVYFSINKLKIIPNEIEREWRPLKKNNRRETDGHNNQPSYH
jgi:hypothetical protein